jgi:hypothetical protein
MPDENPQPIQIPIPTPLGQPPIPQDLDALIFALRQIKRPLSSDPTFTPKTLLDQIQFGDDGSLWLYIGGGWQNFAPVSAGGTYPSIYQDTEVEVPNATSIVFSTFEFGVNVDDASFAPLETSISNAGSGYNIGDQFLITNVEGGDSANAIVVSVDGSGGVTGFDFRTLGNHFITGLHNTTTSGGGSGLTVDILSLYPNATANIHGGGETLANGDTGAVQYSDGSGGFVGSTIKISNSGDGDKMTFSSPDGPDMILETGDGDANIIVQPVSGNGKADLVLEVNTPIDANTDGGNVKFNAGSPNGTGTGGGFEFSPKAGSSGAYGNFIINNLPTSSAGLPSGALWNSSGTIKIV